MSPRFAVTVAAWLALGMASGVGSTAAQVVDDREEGRLLREAAALEGRGELAESEGVLRRLLERAPTSSGGLFALERVLRSRGRVSEVLPLADRYLELEPRGSGIRYMKLRVLVEIDSLSALEAEAERWIAAEPGSPDPWREIARVWEDAYGPERALAVLRRGREALGDERGLALEIGDILARLDRPVEAVEAWSRAIGDAGQGVQSVLRRLAQLPGDPAELVRPLISALDEEPTTVDRRRAAVQVAVERRLEGEAVRLAERTLPGLTLGARRTFLTELARQGEERSTPRVALWAYETLRSRAAADEEARVLDGRIARQALLAGDTARALDAQRRLVRALPAGSEGRMQEMERMVRLETAAGDPAAALERLQAYRAEFPSAPRLDDLVSVVAQGLRGRGLGEQAAAALEGVEGPRTSLERGWLLLAEGRFEEGRAALEAAAGGLPPGEATAVIQLVSLLGRLSPPAASLLVRTAVLARQGAAAAGVKALEVDLGGRPEAERPPLLAQGARTAEAAGLEEDAARLRARLVAEHPDAPERGEAALALARRRAATPEGVPEAIRLLESLIVDRPDAAVVPAARRELQRLRDGSGEARP